MKLFGLALCATAFACAANAEEVQLPTVAAPVPAAMAVAPAGPAVLRVGTQVPLKVAEGITTKGKKLKVGQRFRLETAEAVVLGGETVIPAGSPAMAEITEVRNKGMWGKSGRINARILYVQVNGRQIRLSGQMDDKGTTGTAGVVGAVALIPVAGFFVTGTSAEIPLGAPVMGFVDEDVPLAFAAASPTPLAVAPAAPLAAEAALEEEVAIGAPLIVTE
tara:strand:- start:8846 stop:9505 length:660 start_codon:yes stop_codon:yes gene_type:complete